jgi:rhodanese-related sulfurtransferase
MHSRSARWLASPWIVSSLRVAAVVTTMTVIGARAEGLTVFQATLGETNQKTGEVSTEEVRRVLADGSAIVLDSRKKSEFSAGHIAGAVNVAPGPDAPASAHVVAVERLVRGDKSRALVLYCNGQFCMQSRQLADQLVAAGFTNVRRYQLGIPMWRTVGGLVEVELEGIARIFQIDRTVVYLDARLPEEFTQGSLPGAYNLPADAAGPNALAKAPLPRDDFNTRIMLFGRDGAQARKLAEIFSKLPYQNVSYFPGTYSELSAALRGK